MDGDEVLAAEFGISELVNVGHGSTGYRAQRTFAIRIMTQALFLIERKDCFRHQTLVNADGAVRTIVIVNRCFLSGMLADHKHFDCFIATNEMAPVITFLESEVRLYIDVGNFNICKPGIYLFERRRSRLVVQLCDQF